MGLLFTCWYWLFLPYTNEKEVLSLPLLVLGDLFLLSFVQVLFGGHALLGECVFICTTSLDGLMHLLLKISFSFVSSVTDIYRCDKRNPVPVFQRLRYEPSKGKTQILNFRKFLISAFFQASVHRTGIQELFVSRNTELSIKKMYSF